MKEYSAQHAHEFSWSPSYQYMLKDAFVRAIPQGRKARRVLDVGCGHGDWVSTLTKKGYEYTGVDSSSAMLKIARKQNPGHIFIHRNARSMLQLAHKDFHLIVCIMVYSSFQQATAIQNSLKNLSQLLARDGSIIVAVSHPCFDPYMQKGLMGRPDVDALFDSYYTSGARYQILPPGLRNLSPTTTKLLKHILLLPKNPVCL